MPYKDPAKRLEYAKAYNARRWREDPVFRAKHQARTRRNDEVYLARKKAYVADYLATHPCVDCGESDPVVLEFDHVRGRKEFNIADMWRVSLQRLQREIAKCDVRCANCHRRVTYRRRLQQQSGVEQLGSSRPS